MIKSTPKTVVCEWHIYPHEDASGDWVVQGIDINGEGEIFTTIFTDADAQARAQEYYARESLPNAAKPPDRVRWMLPHYNDEEHR